MDKEVLLHIIDGPGATWGWIAFGFFAMITILTLTRWFNGYEAAVQEGREAERRDGMDQMRAQMSKLVYEQQQVIDKLSPPQS